MSSHTELVTLHSSHAGSLCACRGMHSTTPWAARSQSKHSSSAFPASFPRSPRGALPLTLALFKQAQCLDTVVHTSSLKASLMTFSKGPSHAAKPVPAGPCSAARQLSAHGFPSDGRATAAATALGSGQK